MMPYLLLYKIMVVGLRTVMKVMLATDALVVRGARAILSLVSVKNVATCSGQHV